VPHTIVAKALDHSLPAWPVLLEQFVTLPLRAWTPGGWDAVLTPIYMVTFGGWPRFIVYVGRGLLAVSLCAVAFPRVDALTRALSFALICAVFYLIHVDLFPWYMPPAAMIAYFVFAGVLETLLRRLRVRWPALLLGAAALTFTSSLLLASAWQLRLQQRIIEGQRRAIGEWLRAHRTSPTDTVFLEPLGYIGYYSDLKMYDYPGLSSPEVVAARRKYGENRLVLVAALEPIWVVQRPGELGSPDPRLNQWFLSHYEPVKIFDVSAQLGAVPFLPGRPWLRFDQGFLVWKKRS
jgi:hypothetical protein